MKAARSISHLKRKKKLLILSPVEKKINQKSVCGFPSVEQVDNFEILLSSR